MLRTVLFGKKFHSQEDLEGYLKNYVDLVARNHSFWSRTAGADHFFVGCHDWKYFLDPSIQCVIKTSIIFVVLYLCLNQTHLMLLGNAGCLNHEAAYEELHQSFMQYKCCERLRNMEDITLPVTYMCSAENPHEDLVGKPCSEGSLLPILLQHLENKEPDLKIVGWMSCDVEGKRLYGEYMDSWKKCICARGYEVHTHGVAEAISYSCVPVIISDNYSAAVFPDTELGSIPEEKFTEIL